MQKIIPCLWYKNQAFDAAEFYCSVFKRSKIVTKKYFSEDKTDKDSELLCMFKLEDQDFYSLNTNNMCTFNPSISLFVQCEDQKELDSIWDKLSAVKEAEMCGWLQDKYGVSWQIIPKEVMEMQLAGGKKSKAMFDALLTMKKLDLAKLKAAFNSAG